MYDEYQKKPQIIFAYNAQTSGTIRRAQRLLRKHNVRATKSEQENARNRFIFSRRFSRHNNNLFQMRELCFDSM